MKQRYSTVAPSKKQLSQVLHMPLAQTLALERLRTGSTSGDTSLSSTRSTESTGPPSYSKLCTQRSWHLLIVIWSVSTDVKRIDLHGNFASPNTAVSAACCVGRICYLHHSDSTTGLCELVLISPALL